MVRDSQAEAAEVIHKYLTTQQYPRSVIGISRATDINRNTVASILSHRSFLTMFANVESGWIALKRASPSPSPTVEALVVTPAVVTSNSAEPATVTKPVAKPTYVKGEIHWRPGKPDEELDPIINTLFRLELYRKFVIEKGWEPDYALKKVIGYLIRVHNEIVEAKSND